MAKRNVVTPSSAGANPSLAATRTPCSAATAVKLVELLKLTEQQAQFLLNLEEATEDQIAEAKKVNLPAIGAAFSAAMVAAIFGEPGLAMNVDKVSAEKAAERVSLCNQALSPFSDLSDKASASAKVDAGVLFALELEIFKQLQAKSEVDKTVATRFAPIFAYHHHRYPGRGGKKAGSEQDQAPAAPNKA